MSDRSPESDKAKPEVGSAGTVINGKFSVCNKIDDLEARSEGYFPMQKLLKMLLRISSVTASPESSSRFNNADLISIEIRS